ncbi:hypothetical protein D6D54_09380 [Spiroplasma poulsonii]|uniref:Uncharacterized protein n=1 Tax=Spiroplasma poulsonii TaxID=2138 RepID=A0A433EA30_9MOLU|nr:hypothetical protein [Spiroplasma poulsonii]MBW3058895.1 hypothetical protein [Spiroplasma poulsonii]RUP71035.1 hypothetical protein D6D54_09380 [Spiroplasma poulsonii]
MKLDQNICIVPDCKEIQLLLERGCVFCIEHRKRFDDFLVRNPVSSEIDYFLKKDKEFRNEFWTDTVNYFFIEEEHEYHRKNKKQKKWK